MSTNYAALLAEVKTQLVALAPTSTVTRTYKELSQWKDSELAAGVFMVIGQGVRRYPYEHSDYSDPGGPSQTELGEYVFSVVALTRVAEDADGETIEAAELALLSTLETLADQAIGSEELVDLRIESAHQSGQLEAPYVWVVTQWVVRSIP